MSGKRDYYDVLGVEKTASDKDIKQAYRKVALQYHPDRNPGDTSAEEKFKEAAEAYSVLSAPDKRQIYDRYGHDAVRQAGGGAGFSSFEDVFQSFGSIFEDFFGGRGGGGRAEGGRGRGRRGDDLQLELKLSFLEAARGSEREIEIERGRDCATCHGSRARPGTSPETCPTCRGRGQIARTQGFFSIATVCPHCRGEGRIIRQLCSDCGGEGRTSQRGNLSVKVPAGVDSGARLRLSGEGDGGHQDGPPGDLYIFLSVEPHERFRREENDVILEETVSFTQAALGTRLVVATLDGETEITVPAGTQPGDTVRLRGKGFPALRGFGSGAQVVRIKVLIPTHLSRKQKELLRELARLSGEEA